MGAVADRETGLAEHRFRDAVNCASEGNETYPSGTAFVDAERAEEFAAHLVRYARDGRPIVLVYPDGEERFIRSSGAWSADAWHEVRLLSEALAGRARASHRQFLKMWADWRRLGP